MLFFIFDLFTREITSLFPLLYISRPALYKTVGFIYGNSSLKCEIKYIGTIRYADITAESILVILVIGKLSIIPESVYNTLQWLTRWLHFLPRILGHRNLYLSSLAKYIFTETGLSQYHVNSKYHEMFDAPRYSMARFI